MIILVVVVVVVVFLVVLVVLTIMSSQKVPVKRGGHSHLVDLAFCFFTHLPPLIPLNKKISKIKGLEMYGCRN